MGDLIDSGVADGIIAPLKAVDPALVLACRNDHKLGVVSDYRALAVRAQGRGATISKAHNLVESEADVAAVEAAAVEFEFLATETLRRVRI